MRNDEINQIPGDRLSDDNVRKNLDLPEDEKVLGRERIFCLEFFLTGNTAHAAQAAGYNANFKQMGYSLLQRPRIKNYIKSIEETFEGYAEMNKRQFVDGLKIMCSTHIGDFLDGSWDKLKELKDVPEAKLHAIKEVTIQEFYNRKGKHIKTVTKLKLVDKYKFMEMLAKIENYFEDHNTKRNLTVVKIG